MLYQKISGLCKDRNITIAKLEKECSLGNATIRKWKTSSPNLNSLKKVADLLRGFHWAFPKRERRRYKMILWDVLKQLDADSVASIMFDVICESDTPEKMGDILNDEVTEEELREINDAALWEGRQPLSFVGKQ